MILCLALSTLTQKPCSAVEATVKVTSHKADINGQQLAYTSRFLRINEYLFNGINKLTAIA